jgi:DNA-binding MltR family transcriptional regulator
MSARPVFSLGRYGGPPPDLDHYEITPKEWEDLQEDSKRSGIIVGDALLNDALAIVIGVAFAPNNGVLHTLLDSLELNDRARLAYVLEIIDQRTMQDLHHIHNIRNKWAHLHEPKFSNKEWKKNVLALSTVKKKEEVTKDNYMKFPLCQNR